MDERDQKDLARYRWMRANTHKLGYLGAQSIAKWLGPDNFDERIDEMMRPYDGSSPPSASGDEHG